MNQLFRTIVVAAVAGAVASCGGGGSSTITGVVGSSSCPANTICMGARSFTPTSLTAAPGATVTFTNNSGVTHNVVFDANAPAGGNIGSIESGSQTRTFSTVGNFPFHCTIHSGMAGAIMVQ